MAFSADERKALLALKGVGNTVITRLEEMGLASLQQLAQVDTQDVLALGVQITRSTCWKNSPQARAAIDAVIQYAKSQ
ncbi:MAG: hypothetical protein WBP13_00335 [Methylophilaceae bacterium]